MNYTNLKSFILDNIKENDFLGGMDLEKIKEIESTLNLEIPSEYKKFLVDFGYIGLYGVEIYGYVKSTNYNFLTEQTTEFWSLGLQQNKIVLSNEGEYIVCLDVTTELIVLCDEMGMSTTETKLTFSQYYLNRLQRAKKDFELYG